MNFRIEREREREEEHEEGGGLLELQAKRAPGSRGTGDGSQPRPPRPPTPRCYDMCTALLFSFTTRALHLPGWPSLIKKAWFTCGGSDRPPPPPLPVALPLHFLWARIQLSGVINNHSIEWRKVKFSLYVQKEECLSSPFSCPTSYTHHAEILFFLGTFVILCQFCFVRSTITVPQM